MDTAAAAVAATNSTAYGTQQGARRVNAQTAYMTCQYEWDTTEPILADVGSEPDAAIGTATHHHHCPLPAVLTPGYKRSCHQHVIPTLIDTLRAYLTREQLPDSELPPSLVELRNTQREHLQATLVQLTELLVPPAAKPTRKRGSKQV